MSGTASRRPVGFVSVHHANQHLITDGYDNRAGIGDIAAAFRTVLELHGRLRVPTDLHLSGTLLEALAWHEPGLLDLVREMLEAGEVRLVGGTYAENVMTIFDDDVNRRQLVEYLGVVEELLGCPPERMRICWVPERVWDTDRLAAVLADPTLPNGGYRAVLLDDRILFPTGGRYEGSPRQAYDATGPYADPPAPEPGGAPVPGDIAEPHRPYSVAGGHGLVVVPIPATLRYWVPPSDDERSRLIEGLVERLADAPGDRLLVHADDLEKTAGVAGWEDRLHRYEAFLVRLAARADVEPVFLDDWLEAHPPPPPRKRRLEPGTFYELAQLWRAGEDYRGWSEDPAWAPYAGYLWTALGAVRDADAGGGSPGLTSLAWKHFLASTHETAWRDERADGPGRAPAPWARALASHARSCLVMARAAAWLSGDAGSTRLEVETSDLDGDGEDEVVLRTPAGVAVVTPAHGGRLVYLFARAPGGDVLVVGNPTDHWNFQEELNRFMDLPPNHPGAFTEVGLEHDPWEVTRSGTWEDAVLVELVNTSPAGTMRGARKRLAMSSRWPAVAACYVLPDRLRGLTVECCLSPDYERLLRRGRRDVRAADGTLVRGSACGNVQAWLALHPDEGATWETPVRPEPGHGTSVWIRATRGHFHLLLGWEPLEDPAILGIFEEAVATAHRPADR